MNKLKDDTIPKLCFHLKGNSLSDDISKHLTSNNDAIIVQYIRKGQPHVEAIFTEGNSKKQNKN
jgi:hypothetical protein